MALIDFKNFPPLENLRKKMKAELIEWNDTDSLWIIPDSEKILIHLDEEEIEIDLDDEDFRTIKDDFTFEYKGIKVLLYIRDQYISKYANREYKYHIAYCGTIEKFFTTKRKSRYVVTRRRDGKFRVNVLDGQSKEVLRENIVKKMKVCKYCLALLEYKDFINNKGEVYSNFKLDEFFEIYKSSKFPELPIHNEFTAPLSKYSDDFETVSKELKKEGDYICEECDLKLYDSSIFTYSSYGWCEIK